MNFQLCNMECKNGTLSPLRTIFAFALKREREPIRQSEEGSRSICFYYGLITSSRQSPCGTSQQAVPASSLFP